MLSLQNVTISQDRRTLFSQLNVTFKPGEFWAIIGQNGVGKSTLLEAIAGINQNTTGSILVNQNNIQKMSPQIKAQTFSYLFQDQEPCLAFSVQDAVGMGRFPWQTASADDEKITSTAMQQCRISHLSEKSILKLSGGERRKVEIATCLTQQAQYLLLDEPLNHLDLVYRQHILQVFSEISNQQCVLMVCHDIEAVKQHCTHVLMLLANNCYLAGTSATMLTQDNLNRLFDDHHQ